jgi:hypothetical protein
MSTRRLPLTGSISRALLGVFLLLSAAVWAAGPATGVSAGASGLILPDHRAYELVSPPHNQSNQEVYVQFNSGKGQDEEDLSTQEVFRASVDGNGVAYVADPPSSGGSGSQGNPFGNQWLAARTSQGWEASDVQPPASLVETEYEAFSSDLSTGIVNAFNNPVNGILPLTEDAPPHCSVLYSHTASGYHALFTTTKTPGFCGEHLIFADGNAGTATTASYSRLLFKSEAALIQPAETKETEEYNLYESAEGLLRLVNILPNGEIAPNATFGGPAAGTQSEENMSDFSNAISADGSRIFWTDRKTGDLYVREEGSSTVLVSAGAQPARFWTATPDGLYVFYTEGGKLWRFDVENATREELAGADVQGVIGVNETGQDDAYVYFVAGGALAPGAEPRKCAEANETFPLEAEVNEVKRLEEEGKSEEEATQIAQELGQKEQEEWKEEHAGRLPVGRGCNLYVLRQGGSPAFIAALSPGDDALERAGNGGGGLAGDWQSNLGYRTAEVTPDGRHLAFMSRLSLTGYDNVAQIGEGMPVAETFVYDADSGRISCASCDPTGERPGLTRRERAGAGGYEAARTYEPISYRGNAFMRRWISEDGTRVFFSTAAALAPQDTNGEEDVYEWEQEGASDSSCPQTTPPRADGGCVFLLSGGDSVDASALLDTSANGDDAFFTTRGELVAEDRNQNMDLYDARVGGGFPEVSLACTGTGCQGVPPAPPIFSTPSSVTFSGVGNFEASVETAVKPKKAKPKPKRCRRGMVERHDRCVKNVKKKVGKAGKRSKKGRK